MSALPTGLESLEALLGESIALKRQDVEAKALQERLKRQNLSKAEREATEALVRAWQARVEWRTVANVAVFEHVSCACGYYTEAFSHFMHRQRHRQASGRERLIVADTLDPGMPKETAVQYASVPICGTCAGDKGYNLEKPTHEWEAAE